MHLHWNFSGLNDKRLRLLSSHWVESLSKFFTEIRPWHNLQPPPHVFANRRAKCTIQVSPKKQWPNNSWQRSSYLWSWTSRLWVNNNSEKKPPPEDKNQLGSYFLAFVWRRSHFQKKLFFKTDYWYRVAGPFYQGYFGKACFKQVLN